MTALMFSSSAGYSETMKMLLQHGASLDLTDVRSLHNNVHVCVYFVQRYPSTSQLLNLIVTVGYVYYCNNDLCVTTKSYFRMNYNAPNVDVCLVFIVWNLCIHIGLWSHCSDVGQ